MNAKRGVLFRLHPAAFTLIEMLTVIAIIGILAGILLPTLSMVRAKARMTQAASDISALGQALTAYCADFGAFPPDSADCLPNGAGEPFEDLDSPNEILVWFLTREYVQSGDAGRPTTSGTEWTVGPKDSIKINARITAAGSPYFDVRTKARRDYDQDNFYEFVDPWGRPYMYHAYTAAPENVNSSANPNPNELVLTLNLAAELQPMTNILGKIRLMDFDPPTLNGDFDFEGTGADTVRITFSGPAPAVNSNGRYQFLLHNRQTCDLYSLGPDGKTRGAQNPTDPGGDTIEWKPNNWTATTTWPYDDWQEVWGSPGDGNDVQNDGNIGIADERNRDDVNNW